MNFLFPDVDFDNWSHEKYLKFNPMLTGSMSLKVIQFLFEKS